MRNKIFSVILLVLVFIGCDAQKNFSAKDINKPISGKIDFNGKLEKQIMHTNRISATLKNNKAIIGKKEIQLESNQNILFYNKEIMLVNDSCKDLKIIPLDNANSSKQVTIETNKCIVSASLRDNLVAFVLGDNSLLLYDLDKKDYIYKNKSDNIYAITNKNANPIFSKDDVIFPTLDGRLFLYDYKAKKLKKTIIVGNDKFLNNISYMKLENNTLVASTDKRIFVAIDDNTFAEDIELRDMYFDGKFIFALSLDGRIIKFDATLFALKTIKLPFGQLSAIVIKDNYLYTLEKSSHFLVKVDINNFDYELFKLKVKKNHSVFYNQNNIYVQDRFLDLDKKYSIKLYKS